MGPALITMEGDNDQGAVTTYVSSGANYGFSFYPLLLLLLPVTYYCQEACARIAIVTQKGPITLIKEKFGQTWSQILVFNLMFLNFLTLITEFAGINLIAQALHLNSYIVMPLAILGLCLLVGPLDYKRWERVVVCLCLFDLAWLIASFFMPVVHLNVNLSFGFGKANYLMDIMALIGTTIAPWQLIFQHSCILDKKMTLKQLKEEQKETLFGSAFTIVIAGCMMFVGAIAFLNHIHFVDVPSYVLQLKSILGPPITNLLFLLIFNASVIGTACVTLSTAWAYAENKGLPRSLNQKFTEAKTFYLQYYGVIIAAGLITLWPQLPLAKVIIGVQVIACLFLPVQLIFNHIICNDKNLMGEHVNNKKTNVIMVSIISLMVLLSICLFKQGIGL